MRITDLDIDQGAADALADAGFQTVDELPDDLTSISGIGAGRAEQIRKAIGEAGGREEAAEADGADEVADEVADESAEGGEEGGEAAAGPKPAPVADAGWGGAVDAAGNGILRRTERGVTLKLLVSTAQGVTTVEAKAIDRHEKSSQVFTGDAAIDEGQAWAMAAAEALADSRPRTAERALPVADVKRASTEVLEHRLSIIGDPQAEIDAGKMAFRAKFDELRETIDEAQREIAARRQSWRDESKALMDLSHEKSLIEHEIASRKRKEDIARRRAAAAG